MMCDQYIESICKSYDVFEFTQSNELSRTTIRGAWSPSCCNDDFYKRCLVPRVNVGYRERGGGFNLKIFQYLETTGDFYCGQIPDGDLCGLSSRSGHGEHGCATGEDWYASQYSNGINWSAEEIWRVRSTLCGPGSFANTLFSTEYGGFALREPIHMEWEGADLMYDGVEWFCKKEGCWEPGTYCGRWVGWTGSDLGCYAEAKKKGTLSGDGGEWGGCCSGKFKESRSWRFSIFPEIWYSCT